MEEEQEIFEVVDEHGKFVRTASREECHADDTLIHKAVHCFVFNDRGGLFLQKRALTKIIQPGRWDISVGGHVQAGESFDDALHREAKEELGINLKNAGFLYEYVWKSPRETELVATYQATVDSHAKIKCNESEIEDGKFWSTDEILVFIEKTPHLFTPNFVYEIQRFMG